MSRIVEAEYLAGERILKLASPLEGVGDHERERVVVEQTSRGDWPTLTEEAGRDFARAIRDAFGRERYCSLSSSRLTRMRQSIRFVLNGPSLIH